MKGVAALRRHGIDFHVIAVITEQSLAYPDEIFNFFLEHQMQRVGFNIEEIEGANQASTLAQADVAQKIWDFLQRMYWWQKSTDGVVKIREFDRAYRAIAQGAKPAVYNDQVTPFSIISVDCDGNLSTFSPELLGAQSSTYGDFCFGNIATDDLASISQRDKFKHALKDIQAGLRLCAETCDYY